MNLRRVAAIADKEWREILRDPIVAALAFVLAPTLMLVFGYGLTQDVEHVPLAIADHDGTTASRDYAQHFIGSRHFAFKRYVRHDREADRLLADSVVRVVLVIPERFQEQLVAGRTAQVQALIDGTFTPAARTVGAYVEAINGAVSHAVAVEHLARRLGVPAARAETLLQPVRVDVRYLFNQELRAIVGVAPSLIMFTLSLVAPVLTALSVVRERESGAIYNVYASTVTRAEFLAGKLLPNLVILVINALVLWLMVMRLFGVPFKGDPVAFLLGTALYVLATGTLGLVVSLVVRTQQAALIISMLLTMITVFQFSGMLTPLASLTGITWLVARILPPSHYNTIVQSAFLKGVGAGGTWEDVLVILAHTGLLLGVAWLLFRKRVRA
jgi:ABC-2 type transport system permease protein/ribosome-dependent ATPase